MYVCENVKTALLGRPDLMDLGIVHINIQEVVVGKEKENLVPLPVRNHPNVFTKLGDITGDPIEIELKEGGAPYNLSTPRRVSIP